jgi:hypothetical protein
MIRVLTPRVVVLFELKFLRHYRTPTPDSADLVKEADNENIRKLLDARQIVNKVCMLTLCPRTEELRILLEVPPPVALPEDQF